MEIDDTFNRLRRCSYEEVDRFLFNYYITSHFDSWSDFVGSPDGTEILKANNWTLYDYIEEGKK